MEPYASRSVSKQAVSPDQKINCGGRPLCENLSLLQSITKLNLIKNHHVAFA